MDAQLLDAKELLLNKDDWNKRIRGLQAVRRICEARDDSSEKEIISGIFKMEAGLVAGIKDLRSQVCKEASITICCLAEHLGLKLLKLFEVLLQCSMELCQTSAKVMANAGIEASNAIVKRVESPKLLQIVLSNSSNKAKEIRRLVQQLVLLMLSDWSHNTLESNITAIVNCIKTGINDADKDSREVGRRNFHVLDEYFHQEAQSLLQLLDSNRRKGLLSISGGSSTVSLVSIKDTSIKKSIPAPSAKHPGFLSKRSMSVTDISYKPSRSLPPLRASNQASTQRTPVFMPNISAPKEASSNADRVIPLSESVRRFGSVQRLGTPSQGTVRTPACLPMISVPRENICPTEVVVLSSESDDDLLEESYGLRHAMTQIASDSISEKQIGLQYLLNMITSWPTRISDDDSKMRVYELLKKIAEEGNHKIIGLVCETLAQFLLAFASSMEETMPSLLTTMLRKRSSELLPKSQESLDSVVDAIGHSFPANKRFYAMCGFIGGAQFSRQSTKAKEIMMTYTINLLSLGPSSIKVDSADVKSAISTIGQIRDTGSPNLRSLSTELLDRLHDMQLGQNKLTGESLSGNITELGNVQEREGEILLPTPVGSSLEGDNFSSVAAMQLLLGDLTVNDNAESPDLQNTNVSVREDSVILIEEPVVEQRGEPLNDLLATLKQETSENDLRDALRSLPDMIEKYKKDKVSTLNKLHPALLTELCDKLMDSRLTIRLGALKSLNKLSNMVADRMSSRSIEEVMRNILKASQKFDEIFNVYTIAAERECMITLAKMLPSATVLALVIDVLSKENDGDKALILNMTSAWMRSLNKRTLENMAPEIIPPIIRTYNCERSGVRKGVVFTLVHITLLLGREKVEHLINDLGKGMPVFERYLKTEGMRWHNEKLWAKDIEEKRLADEKKLAEEKRVCKKQ